MQTPLYPLLFKPVYQDYIWGGTRIPKRFQREAPTLDRYAESWEVSDREEGMSVVRNGPLAGQSLRQLTQTYGKQLIGTAWQGGPFPLLIKIIDARETLSVQVHPDNQSAQAHGGDPKTEMWYFLDAEPDAEIFIGLKPGTGEATLRRALADETVKELLNPVAAEPGRAVFVPGGRVHAIGAGCLLLEVQQNSNTTYRVYDWGRVGQDGKPRPLHVEQAMRVIRWSDERPVTPDIRTWIEGRTSRAESLVTCDYFRFVILSLKERLQMTPDAASCRILFVAEGSAGLECGAERIPLPTGTTCLIPAALESCTLAPDSDPVTIARISIA